MKVFIVTPAFNSAETLNRTILSVVSQAGDFSIYYHVQDGGSKDGTGALLERWERLLSRQLIPISCRSIYFTWSSATDEGMYDAIGKGFKRFSPAPNDWMTWINADDILLPTALPLLSRIDGNPDLASQVHWITGAVATARDGCQDVLVDRPMASEFIATGVADGKHWEFIQQEGTSFRAHTWQQVGCEKAFSGLKLAGDWNLWRLLAKHQRIFQFKYPTGLFSSRPGQLSKLRWSDYEREMDSVIPFQLRQKHLLGLKGRDISAWYLTPHFDGASLRVENRPINNHLEYRLQVLNEREHKHKTKSSATAKDKPSERLANHQSLQNTSNTVPVRVGNILIYDAEWQFPAITEQHSYQCIKSTLPSVDGVVYLAFPWATLIDLRNTKKPDANRLLNILTETSKYIKTGERVITVCQHILMLNYQNMFKDAGVTDVFWTHAIKDQPSFPKHQSISIYPFPLYPVQSSGINSLAQIERSILYSFVGARSNKWYLTQSRDHIVKNLSKDKRGLIIARDQWHYNNVVYGHQINKLAIPVEHLVNLDASQEFVEILKKSIFSLCPSGSGPNSIRLWESIGLGAIPVILADTYLPPGDPLLWEEAVVFCEETEEAIQALPGRLEQMAKDENLLSRKRKAMKQLWMLYGPDNLIYDIHKLYLELAKPAPQGIAMPIHASEDALLILSGSIDKNSSPESLKFFMLSCTTRAMRDHQGFKKLIKSNKTASEALALSLQLGNSKDVEMTRRVFQHRNIDLIRLGIEC